jgi:hypothetical protein
MTLRERILNPLSPVVFFEQVPPAADKPGALETTLAEVAKLRSLADAINLPEILDESRGGASRLPGRHYYSQPQPGTGENPRQAGGGPRILYEPDAVRLE